MKKLLSISLVMFVCIAMSAQPKTFTGTWHMNTQTGDEIVLAKSVGAFMPRPDVVIDKKTMVDANRQKTSTAAWSVANFDWIKENCGVVEPPVEKDYLKIFPEVSEMPLDEQAYMPMSWKLSLENNETVLHCYLRMPSDIVTNLWLTGEETCIVDNETGVQYRIRRTEPNTYRQHFDVKAKKGDVVDFKIFFAPLPETTKEISIYGVPNWNMMGMKQKLTPYAGSLTLNYDQPYDTIPKFHQPRLLKEHMSEDKPYDLQNWNTWKVLTDAHLIKPQPDGTRAVWLTPEATYIAVAYEQNWTAEYWGFDPETMLVDEAGHQYKLREVQGVPLGETFFMEGCAGDYVAYLEVYDPLPLGITSFTCIIPKGEPFSAWGANWSGQVLHNLSVKQLRQNQKLFDYHPRIIVK